MNKICKFHYFPCGYYMEVDTINLYLPHGDRMNKEADYFEQHYLKLGYTIKYFDRSFYIGREYAEDNSYKTIIPE